MHMNPFRVKVHADGSWTCPGCSHHQAPQRVWIVRLDLIEVGGRHARWHARNCPDLAALNQNVTLWAGPRVALR